MDLFHEVESAPSRVDYDDVVHEDVSPIVHEAAAPRFMKQNCPTLEDIAEFIEGVIDKKKAIFIKDHLAHCPDCTEKLETGSDAVDRHSRGKSDSTPEEISEETSSRLDELYRKSLSRQEDPEDDL